MVAVCGLLLSFWIPPVRGLGFAFKLFFLHVPCAWLMLLSALVSGAAAAVSLFGHKPDDTAASAAELAFVFGLGVMISGPLWAWQAWGRPWVWEPRLTTSLVCWLTFAAAVWLRSSTGEAGVKIALILEMLGAANVPLVYISVTFWQGAHHPPLSVVPTLIGRYGLTLALCCLALTGIWVLLFRHARGVRRDTRRLERLMARHTLVLDRAVPFEDETDRTAYEKTE